MDFKRINDLSEAYRHRVHDLLATAFGHSNYDMSDKTETARMPTVNIVDDQDFEENGAWVTVQVWVPKSDVRNPEAEYRISFHQTRTVNIIASSADEAREKFERGEWEDEDAEDDRDFTARFLTMTKTDESPL